MSQTSEQMVPDCPVPQAWPQRTLNFKDPRLIALVISCLISSVQGIDPSLHAVAMPFVGQDIIVDSAGNVDLAMVGLVRSIGTIVLAASMLGVGIIGDANGRKRIMILGAYGMGIAALISAFAPGTLVFGLGRVIMGFTTAMSFGMCLAFVPSLYHKHELPKAFSIWLAIQSFMIVAGTMLGGPILSLTNNNWRGIYIFIAVIVVLFGLAAQMFLPENKAASVRKFDTVGVFLAAVALILLVYALGQASTRGFGDPIVWGGSLGALALLGVFAVYESRIEEPGFPIQLFKIPAFLAACLAGIMFNFANGSMLGQSNAILGSLKAQGITTDPNIIAMLSALLAVGCFVGAVAAGPAMNKLGMDARAMFVTGMIILGAGLLSQMLLTEGNRVIIIAIGMFTVGYGIMWTQAPQSAVIMGSAPKDLVGAVGAVKPAVGQMGMGIGFGVSMPLATIFMQPGERLTISAYSNGLAISGVILFVLAGLIFILMRSHGEK